MNHQESNISSKLDSLLVIQNFKQKIDRVTLGDRKAPQSALSKDQMGLLRDIADSELTLEEKNTLLRYLYFDSVAYSRCLESDFAKETKQKNDIKKENEKLKERIAKLSELNSRYQELNTALTAEIERIKGKEKDMINEEKRLREKVIDQFMVSLDDLNAKVEENSKANETLLEENRYLREQYKEKIGQYQEQAKTSKEIISKLSEMNSLYEKQVDELTMHLNTLAVKAQEGEQLKKTVEEYVELAKKQDKIIQTMKEHRDSLKKVVAQYDKSFTVKNNEIKTKNKQVNDLQMENAKLRKQVDELTQQLQKVEAVCRYLQKKRQDGIESDDDLL